MLKTVIVALLAAMAVVVAVVAFRTITFEPPVSINHANVTLASAPAIDFDAAAQRLAQAVRFKTVSHQDSAQNETAEWDRFHAWLQTTYPAFHGVAQRSLVAGQTLIYSWPGSDTSLQPIVLMAHQDVVPVEAEAEWTHPPFDGIVTSDAVWGRGTLDDKGSLVGIFEAANALVEAGFSPTRTVMIIAGHDEETGGTGAAAAAEFMASRNMTASFVIDEGLITVADFPMLKAPAALVGVAEKGYATLQVTAKSEGGHSSMPPPQTSVDILSRALVAISQHPHPMTLDGPGGDMVRTLAPYAPLITRIAVANEWLLGRVLIGEIARSPASAALLHTTMAPTMLEGSPKENVLPSEASALINYRILPGQTVDDVIAHTREAVADLPVEIAWVGVNWNPSKISSVESDGWRIIAALASEDGKTPVAPGLVLARTDSSQLSGVADNTYRYLPVHLTLEELKMIHGADEHITLTNLRRLITFYARLIATASANR